ncbi:YdaS family helix-turn-helix protein [Castellaniella sp. FW104-16D08]|uniref:transcriptional regulator n=1 Tax=unclassified Castellaniella TaxID=2617606 RepID=UPI00331621B7
MLYRMRGRLKVRSPDGYKHMSDFQPVREACAVMGGMTKLANKLGIPVPVVSGWASGSLPVPIIRCVEIEEITGGSHPEAVAPG